MKIAKILNTLLILVFTLPAFTVGEELKYEVISEGYLSSDDRTQSMVVKEKDVLNELLLKQGKDKKLPAIDFPAFILLFLI